MLHVDLDAFYASVAARDQPALAEVPMWVGGGDRGVVLSANYLARSFGVSGGMSTAQARRRCPDAVIVPPDFAAYDRASSEVFRILRAVTDAVEAASIDEAYLEVAGANAVFGTPVEIAKKIQASINHFVGIAASIGVAENKLLAKVASAAAKPAGIKVVRPGAGKAFLAPLPVAALPGVGTVAEARLHELGLYTVAQLAQTPQATLTRAFGLATGRSFAAMAQGIGARQLTLVRDLQRSLGQQHTADLVDLAAAEAQLLRLAISVAARLRAANLLGARLEIEVRSLDWRVTSKTMALAHPTDLTTDLYQGGRALLPKLFRPRLRRLALRVSQLSSSTEMPQQSSLDEREDRERALAVVCDRLTKKYGPTVISRATLVDN